MSIVKEILDKINLVLTKDVEFIEMRKISTLDVGKIYLIQGIKILNTRFGRAILVILYDEGNNLTFQSFLPKRVSDTLTDDTVKIINEAGGKYTLTDLGQGTKVFSGNVTKILLNFGYIE